MKSIEIPITEVKQNAGTLYVGKIKGYVLYNLAKADIRRIDSGQTYKGMQRELDSRRVKRIIDYLNTSYASFPNSIILSVESDNIIQLTDKKLIVKDNQDTFSIIDGQHRLAGFKDGNFRDFELIVSIFIDLDQSDKVLLFSTINSEQRKVDPSLKLDLENYSIVDTPGKIVSQIALAFHVNPDSPWYGKIKIIGRKDASSENAVISLYSFAEPIINYIYDSENDNHKLRETLLKSNNSFDALDDFNYDINRYILWRLYRQRKQDVIYKILFNYFVVIRNLFEDDWGKKESILTKSNGYNALTLLFKDVFMECSRNKDFSQDKILSILEPLSQLTGKITSQTYGASGLASANALYNDMKGYLTINACKL